MKLDLRIAYSSLREMELEERTLTHYDPSRTVSPKKTQLAVLDREPKSADYEAFEDYSPLAAPEEGTVDEEIVCIKGKITISL